MLYVVYGMSYKKKTAPLFLFERARRRMKKLLMDGETQDIHFPFAVQFQMDENPRDEIDKSDYDKNDRRRDSRPENQKRRQSDANHQPERTE